MELDRVRQIIAPTANAKTVIVMSDCINCTHRYTVEEKGHINNYCRFMGYIPFLYDSCSKWKGIDRTGEERPKSMTRVICGFDGCKYWTKGEYLGICMKNEIILDEAVDGIFVGCPDAEWDYTKGGWG